MDLGYVVGELSAIKDEDARRALQRIFTHMIQDIRFGEPQHHTKALNFGAYYQAGTAPATPAGEFSIQHGLTTVPRFAIPLLNLNQQGAQVVPLETARVADGKRIYLKTAAGFENAAVLLLVE
jgi:hypothetical protein